MKTGIRYGLVEHVGGRLAAAYMRTLNVRSENDIAYRARNDAGKPVIFVLWHGRLLPLGYVHRDRGATVLVSQSSDGEYISRVLRNWGFGTIRGSSSNRGGSAFRELVRSVRAGRSVAITPDGPRGPRERVKPGVVQLAQITGVPVVAAAAAASSAWWFTGWDRFLVPRPFAKLHVAYANPIDVPRDADLGEFVDRVETALNEVTAMVDTAVG